MGIFNWIEDVAEGVAETVVRLPEIPIRTVKGVNKGLEDGVEKLLDSFDFDD